MPVLSQQEIDLVADRVLERLEVCGCGQGKGTPWQRHLFGCLFGAIGYAKAHG